MPNDNYSDEIRDSVSTVRDQIADMDDWVSGMEEIDDLVRVIDCDIGSAVVTGTVDGLYVRTHTDEVAGPVKELLTHELVRDVDMSLTDEEYVKCGVNVRWV